MSSSVNWDRAAASYDVLHGLRGDLQKTAWRQLFQRLFPAEQPLRILDAGTGTGFVAGFLAELGHDVVGLDYAPQMLAIAKERMPAQGLSLRFVLGDAASPAAALPDERFDAVVSRYVLWTFVDPERAVQAWSALVAPGGRIVTVDGVWSEVTFADQVAAHAGYALEAVRTRSLPPRFRGDPLLPLRHVRDDVPARNVFLRAGLSDVRSEMLPAIDRVEQSVMSLEERLRYRWRRYLVEGSVGGRSLD